MELPQAIYYWAGAVIITNIGTIASLVFFGARAVWWLSKLDSRVEKAQETANRAHKRIDIIEED